MSPKSSQGLYKRKVKGPSQKEEVMTKEKTERKKLVDVTSGFEDKRQDPWPRNTSKSWERQGNGIFQRGSRRNTTLLTLRV